MGEKLAGERGGCDVDQSDFGIFQRCYSGEDVPADPACANGPTP